VFSGIVDPTEEILPQSLSERGPGPIARALASLYSMDQIVRQSQSSVPQQSSAPINFNITIEKIERDVDVDNLLFRIRSELGGLMTREGGYRRGGTVGR
jgi:hypothetical protein